MADQESLEAKIKLDIIEAMESRIQDRFERDRSFLRETVGAAVKILTVALTIVAVILTLFGIKTINDINEVIIETTEDEIGKRLDETNPTVRYAAEVETLYNRLLIQNLDLKIKSGKRSAQITISEDEMDRILATLDQAETRDDTFAVGVEVLARTATRAQWGDIAKKFREMIRARDPYRWLEEADIKRSTLIAALQGQSDQSHGLVRDIARNPELSPRLRIAAVEFLGVTGDYQADTVDLLADLTRSSNQSLATTAVLALARLSPTHETIGAWIDTIDRNADVSQLAAAFELVDSLLQGPYGSPNKPATSSEPQVVRIFERLASSGVALRIWPESAVDEGFSTTLVAYRPPARLNYHPIPAAAVLGWKSRAPMRALIEQASRTGEAGALHRVVSLFTIGWGNTEHVGAAIHVKASGSARIRLEQDSALTADTLPSGAILVARPGDPRLSVRAVWSDAAGAARSEAVVAFGDIENIEFTLERADRFGYVFLPLR